MRQPTLIAGLAVAYAAAASCSKSAEETGAGGAASSSSATSATSAGGSMLSFSNGSGGGCDLGCSSDMHAVVDCNGQPVKSCPPDQGCAGGQCVPACQAAQQSKSSIGCEYYAHNPVTQDGRGCHALFIANTWTAPLTFGGDVGGAKIDLGKYAYLPKGSGTKLTLSPLGAALDPGQVAIVFLRNGDVSNGGIACPKPAAETDPNAGAWTDGNDITDSTAIALRLTTSAPAVVYDIQPFGGGPSAITDAALLLPTSTWDGNYIAVTPRPFGKNTLKPTLVIVGSEDATNVTLLPTVAIVKGTQVSPSPANTPASYKLSRGQVLKFKQQEDLLGSVITADKPVGVWGEQNCINIDAGFCDAAHEQIPPIRALGSEYVVVRYRNRVAGMDESPPVRITGAVDGTQLSWDPTPSGASATVGRGESIEVRSSVPFVVKSQDDKHPFYVAAYMTGGDAFQGRGDPEFVNVIPAAQYLEEYLFFTDPTYPETNLVFVRKKGKDGFADVTLDCAGTLTGWQPVGAGGSYEFTRVDVSTGNFQGVGKCDNGQNHASSKLPFTLTVWGWGSDVTGDQGTPGYSQYVSYAYPAGARIQSINDVVVPPNPK